MENYNEVLRERARQLELCFEITQASMGSVDGKAAGGHSINPGKRFRRSDEE